MCVTAVTTAERSPTRRTMGCWLRSGTGMRRRWRSQPAGGRRRRPDVDVARAGLGAVDGVRGRRRVAASNGLPRSGAQFPGGMTAQQQNPQTKQRRQSPVVAAHLESRAAHVQLRIADAITTFAGSMKFVYIHAVVFAIWMLLIERNPCPKLTLIVSLEAIFLSTFVMIGQNRQASFQQAKADHDFLEQEQELKLNTEVTKQIHELAKEIHQRVYAEGTPG